MGIVTLTEAGRQAWDYEFSQISGIPGSQSARMADPTQAPLQIDPQVVSTLIDIDLYPRTAAPGERLAIMDCTTGEILRRGTVVSNMVGPDEARSSWNRDLLPGQAHVAEGIQWHASVRCRLDPGASRRCVQDGDLVLPEQEALLQAND